ncbi:SusD family protein [compost metagenome]
MIWASGNEAYGSISSGDGLVRRATPRSQGGYGNVGPTQELVDAFFMKNGKSINDSGSGYSEVGFSTVTEVPAGRSEAGTFNMYVNREPRFYASIVYHGKKWPVTNALIKFTKGNGNDIASNYSITGYNMYKRLNRTVSQSVTTAPKTFYRPSFIFRLAEFYLLYAEALNEVNPADPKIAQYVDLVRERAGIPKWSVSNPAIIGNQALQREAIRKESRVELCFEGQRYFDVRRWMIAENASGQGAQGGPFYGMNVGAETDADFLKRTQYETRVFTRAYYLWPIPLGEIQKSTKLVQNPGW